MAEVIDVGGAVAAANLVTGNSRSLTFTLPGSVQMRVESVVATVDNGSVVEVTPALTIKDSSGEVMATKTQDDAIPAGDSGTASFALRVDNSGGAIRFKKNNIGAWLQIFTTGVSPDGFGVLLEADDQIGLISDSQGIFLGADAGGITLDCSNSDINMDTSGGDVDIQTGAGNFNVTATGTGDINLTTSDTVAIEGTIATVLGAGGVSLNFSGSGGVTVTDTSDVTVRMAIPPVLGPDGVYFRLRSGQPFSILNSSGNPIFKVDEDGDLHGLTGKTITFDL